MLTWDYLPLWRHKSHSGIDIQLNQYLNTNTALISLYKTNHLWTNPEKQNHQSLKSHTPQVLVRAEQSFWVNTLFVPLWNLEELDFIACKRFTGQVTLWPRYLLEYACTCCALRVAIFRLSLISNCPQSQEFSLTGAMLRRSGANAHFGISKSQAGGLSALENADSPYCSICQVMMQKKKIFWGFRSDPFPHPGQTQLPFYNTLEVSFRLA